MTPPKIHRYAVISHNRQPDGTAKTTIHHPDGTKTHPLTPTALATLRQLTVHPIPKYKVNPGLIRRLVLEKLVEVADLPFQFKNGVRDVPHLRITAVGWKRVGG